MKIVSIIFAGIICNSFVLWWLLLIKITTFQTGGISISDSSDVEMAIPYERQS